MEKILVICAHPDEEVLGCGGTLLKHKKKAIKSIYYLFLRVALQDIKTKMIIK